MTFNSGLKTIKIKLVKFNNQVASYGKTTLNFKDIVKSPVFLDSNQILEVKFCVELPSYLADILQTIPFIRSSISKHVLCQRYVNFDLRKDFIVPSF